MSLCHLAPAYIRAIAPYQPGKPISELQRELGLKEVIKLASNENPLGPSPCALQAIQSCLKDLARYPDGNAYALKAALSRHLGVSTERLVIGNGSNDVLELSARAFLTPASSGIYCQHAFAVYALAIQAVGARGIEVPAKEFGTDAEGILRALSEDTRMVFIANPNNPTGTLLTPDELRELISAIPSKILVVLDEAYNEYLPPEMRADSVTWLERFPNLIITRTFSKIYGLAGLRIGYAVAHAHIADMLNRVRQPFNVNSVAQEAAIHALQDHAFIRKSYETNLQGKMQLTHGLEEMGLAYIPSFANFISFYVGEAERVYQGLLQRGIIVRPIANYGLPEYLRVSIGLEQENALFLEALKGVI